ncbi:hypothetical protein [Microbacterium suwonense]|uniref:Uncharacterized protein n=1 Tax=Microbacterium suwonense TaxID=683047 RepID=A0ABN6X5T7_9MICO|nr:hypothetical protein [Microbacterium suwonense]BDZ40064.1 hypothetical protein GCM10025863_26780 [Microbacterium suwonense]
MTGITAEEVATAQLPQTPFPTVRSPSYDIGAVDELLEACRAALASWQRGEPATLTAKQLLRSRLKGARMFKAGYAGGPWMT